MLGALLVAILAGAVKPTLELRVWPSANGTPAVQFAPATYEARVIFRDPGHVANCPAFEWTWGPEGSSGWEESSCDPFAADELQPTEYRPARRTHVFRTGGVHRVEVVVRGGDRRKAYRATKDVTVIGPSLEEQ